MAVMTASEEKVPEPRGVIAIMTMPDGHVAATHADFNRQGYGGVKLWDAQRIRAGDAVKRKAVRAYCSDLILQALEAYTIDRIADDLIQRGKWRITYRAIGWDQEATEAIERR